MRPYVRLILLALLGALSFPVAANTFYYNTSAQAQHFCNLDYQSPSYGSNSGACPGPTVIGAISQCNGGSASKYSFTYAGNLRSYIYCQSSNIYCPNGGTWSNTNQTCTSPCPPPGELRTIAVKSGTYENPTPDREWFDMDIGRSYNDTAYIAGVQYAFTWPSDYDVEKGCFYDADEDNSVYCNYNAVTTGTCSTQQTDSATDDKPAKPDVQSTKTESGNLCMTDTKGNTVCSDSPSGNKKCGTVNGNKVCFDTTPGVGTVNGQPYQTSDKNCGFVNGQPVCVSGNSTSPTTKGCLTNGGVKNCVNTDYNQTTTESTTQNPDGSTTTTKTTTSNGIGEAPTTTTTTTGTNGTTTTTTPGSGGTGGDAQQGLDLSAIAKNTRETADNTKSIADSLNPGDVSTELNDGGEGDKLTDAINQFGSGMGTDIGNISGEGFSSGFGFSSMFPGGATCQGITMTWKTYTYELDPCAKLAFLRTILYWLMAALTLFRLIYILTSQGK
jgi:hypothetical protein